MKSFSNWKISFKITQISSVLHNKVSLRLTFVLVFSSCEKVNSVGIKQFKAPTNKPRSTASEWHSSLMRLCKQICCYCSFLLCIFSVLVLVVISMHFFPPSKWTKRAYNLYLFPTTEVSYETKKKKIIPMFMSITSRIICKFNVFLSHLTRIM